MSHLVTMKGAAAALLFVVMITGVVAFLGKRMESQSAPDQTSGAAARAVMHPDYRPVGFHLSAARPRQPSVAKSAAGQKPLDTAGELAALANWMDSGQGNLNALHKIAADSGQPVTERLRAARALAGIGSHEALQALFDAIWDETDPTVQRSLVSTLDSFGAIETIDSLVSVLEAPESPVIHAAVIDTISRLAQASTVFHLLELSKQTAVTSEAGSPALEALSAIRNEESIPALAAILSRADAPPFARQAAATSLARMGTKESLLQLSGVDGTGSKPNAYGIQALASIQDPAAVSSLKTLLGASENIEVAQAISRSLQSIKLVHDPIP